MKKSNSILLFALFLTGIIISAAQTPGNPTSVPSNPLPDWVRINAQKRAEIERITIRDPNKNILIVPAKNSRLPAPPQRAEPPTEEEARAAAEKAERLGVSQDYRSKYREFLIGSYTGINRIFPDKNCGMGEVVTLAEMERCAEVPEGRGGGSMFSFRCVPDLTEADRMDRFRDAFMQKGWDGCATKLTTDIRFKDGRFVTGDAGIVQGLMADIGDVDLEKIDLKHKALDFLGDYDPMQTKSGVAEQDKVLARGIGGNGYTFSNSLPVKVNSTYVLRSVLYRYHEQGADEPRRGVDVRVAFRVVGHEADGSIVILWKELDRRYPRRRMAN